MIKNFCMRKILLFILSFLILPVNAFNLSFFERFNDCYFEDYIKEALINNHDLKQADYRVKQYRYEINSVLSKEFPQLSVSSNYLGTHFPKGDMNVFLKKNSFILPFRLNFEPDFLLKTKDKINSKKFLYKGALANQKSTYLTLLGDVASTYVNILLYDYLINQQKEILKNKDKNLSFDFNKFKFGVIDLINLNTAKEEFNSQQLIYDTLIKNQNTNLYNFSLLLGRSANCIDEIKRGRLEDFEYQETIPEIISSDLIYARPDVIEIENKLKSAKLDVTIAKKDFFPTFNIMGILAFDTAGGGNFFSWGSSFAYLLAGASQDIFKGGEKIANLRIKKARFNELVENYKQTDLTAIKEIANALNIIKQDKINEKTSNNQLEIEKKNYLASNKKFNRGIISRIEFLNDKNSYLQQKQLSATSKAVRLVDYFTLYKAVGGEL